MANQVGNLTFDVMRGSPSPPGTVAEALPRAVGEDYNRWRLHGLQGRDTQITAVVFLDDETSAFDRRKEIIDQQGSELEIVDAFDRTYLNCQILMSAAAYRPVYESGANKYRVIARYIVRQGSET
tara:strand:- start:1767 stop:2141 length:375 start_codon:yes stop_codon:yes gene_type:complete